MFLAQKGCVFRETEGLLGSYNHGIEVLFLDSNGDIPEGTVGLIITFFLSANCTIRIYNEDFKDENVTGFIHGQENVRLSSLYGPIQREHLINSSRKWSLKRSKKYSAYKNLLR